MPLIGIAACRKLEDYRQSITHVGGDVHILDIPMKPVEAIGQIDGLLLTGGGDVAPARYGEAPHPSVVDVDLVRDEFEIALIAEARKRKMPIFAICRGVQVLNVACGGTLVQDIPSAGPSELAHSIDVPKDHLAHAVRGTPGTRLAAALGPAAPLETCAVNSPPHQAAGQGAP